MAKAAPPDHLTWHAVHYRGKQVNYGVAGEGLPVLFVHGWALGHHAYKRALKRLVRLGCRVYAPALPGFGGSTPLRVENLTVADYAEWLDGFVEAVGVEEPMFTVGHSLGGAVATKLAHDFPERVGYLVLINAVGGGAWLRAGKKVRSLTERPLLDWVISFPVDLLLAGKWVPTLRAILEDLVPNMINDPIGLWNVAWMARRSMDLRDDLTDLRERGLPVLVLWGEGDSIIPKASFDALCAAVGSAGQVVPGRHAWLLADPDTFGEVMANSVAVARAARNTSRKVVPMRAAGA